MFHFFVGVPCPPLYIGSYGDHTPRDSSNHKPLFRVVGLSVGEATCGGAGGCGGS